jgi:undecaprenyl-diphosphatase
VIEALDIDQYLLSAFNRQLTDYRWFFYIITQIGSPLALTLLASAAFLLGKNKIKIFAMVLMIGLLFSIVVMNDIKDLVKRPRPEGANTMYFLIKNDYSFPSGHALAIFLVTSVLGAYFGWKYYIAGYVLALAVSLSRLYLGVHYPSDVLAGAVIGAILGELLIFAAYRLGLCDKIGLLSPILKSANVAPVKYDTGALDGRWPLSVVGFLAVTSAIIFYYTDFAALAILALAVATMLVVLYIALSNMPASRTVLIAFVLVSLGFVSALSMFYLSAYALSLAVAAITYLAIIALTHTKSKTI